MDAFDQVIAGLEKRGAFKDVPVPDGVVLPHEFKSLKPAGNMPYSVKYYMSRYGEHVPQGVADYQFDNIRAALNAYMPQELLMPWLRQATQAAMRGPLSPIAKELFTEQIREMVSTIDFMRQKDNGLSTHPSRELDLADTKKEGVGDLEITLAVQKRHPAFAVAMTVFQTAHLDFLCGLAQKVRDTDALSDEQKKTAAWSLQVLSRIFSTNNFLSPTIQIAKAYHERVGGNYAKPMQAEDFVKGWEALYYGRGFHSRMGNMDGTPVVSRCPFKSRATQASAQIAGNEVVTTDRNSIRTSMGFGAWCLYRLATASRIQSAIRFVQVRSIMRSVEQNWYSDAYNEKTPYETRMHKLVGAIHARPAP